MELTQGRGIPRAEHCWQKSDAIALSPAYTFISSPSSTVRTLHLL